MCLRLQFQLRFPALLPSFSTNRVLVHIAVPSYTRIFRFELCPASFVLLLRSRSRSPSFFSGGAAGLFVCVRPGLELTYQPTNSSCPLHDDDSETRVLPASLSNLSLSLAYYAATCVPTYSKLTTNNLLPPVRMLYRYRSTRPTFLPFDGG